jgi:crossover junction endodeoxyribonuclease RusA
MSIRIEVRGTPAPQGSKRHVGGGRMIEQSKAVGPWRNAVRTETQRVMEDMAPLTGPVSVYIAFWLPRPKTLPKKVTLPAKRPDLDKLCRAVLDGLTDGGVWNDDGQVQMITAQKLYATEADPPGAMIVIDDREDKTCS